jgi:hypothetical protein
MAAMTLAAPVALAPARFSKVVRRRSTVTGKAVSPASASRGAVQVRAAIAMPNPGTPVTYNETGKWRETFDLAAWASEVRAVEKELKADIDQDDVKHLNKILTWANAFYFGGLAILFATPFLTNAFNAIGGVNPIAAFCMSTAICARWTMVGHHVCHGGYNTAQSENGVVTGRFHRRTFAKGLARRITDWMDWMMPEAWDVEHNHLHHYQVRLAIDHNAIPPIARPDRDAAPTASPRARTPRAWLGSRFVSSKRASVTARKTAFGVSFPFASTHASTTARSLTNDD